MRRHNDNVFEVEDSNIYAEDRLPILFLTKLTSLLKVCKDPLINTTSKGRGFNATTNIIFESIRERKALSVLVKAAEKYVTSILIDEEDKPCCHIDTFVKDIHFGLIELRIRLNYRYPTKYHQNRSRY